MPTALAQLIIDRRKRRPPDEPIGTNAHGDIIYASDITK